MAIKVNYYDGDTYTAADDIEPWKQLLEDGVFGVSDGQLLVTQQTPANLSVNVAAGNCVKSGLFFKSDGTVNKSITSNTSGSPRIDIVVCDVTDPGAISVVAGTPAGSPVAPTATATQIVLAEVYVGNGVTEILTANITDKREQTVTTLTNPNNVEAVNTLTKIWTGTATAYAGLTPASDTLYVIVG